MSKLASWWDRELDLIIKLWGVEYIVDNSKSIDILGIKYTSVEVSLAQMFESLVKSGVIQEKRFKVRV